jgi:hypothetical protein
MRKDHQRAWLAYNKATPEFAKSRLRPRRTSGQKEGKRAVLKGYTVPLSPLGLANLAPPPPWHYSSDVVAAEFWVNRDAAQAALPPRVTIDGAGEARAVIMFLDASIISRLAWSTATGRWR